MTRSIFCLATTFLLLSSLVIAADRPADEMQAQAVAFLKARQNPDGSWTHPSAVGITGLVTTALLAADVPVDQPVIRAALQQLQSHVRSSGGVYASDSVHRNYETCIAIMAFSEANMDGRYDETIERARGFLQGLQWDSGEGIESSDPAWGGAGYGRHQRPDLCNTEFMIEAMRTEGLSKDDPVMQMLLTFVSRTQNLESAHNDTDFAGLINDGGFYYTPAAGGDSKAGTEPNGGLRSYGSMTYAGVKSLIYAGLEPDDPRVEAATEWIRNNYTLDRNPGMGAQGLYYYYHTFAKTMAAFGADEFVDADGRRHDWRQELTERLGELQRPNGSWVNPADRWEEGDPHLVTAYCLLALSHCRPTVPEQTGDSPAAGNE